MRIRDDEKEGVMPKEVVSSGDEAFALVVGWEPDTHMQIGVQTAGHLHLVWQLFGPGVADLGAKMRDLVLAHEEANIGSHAALGSALLEWMEQTSGPVDSLWFHPDRASVNRLVKALRRARNAVFGADE